jgi:hypothetical protein
MKAKSFVIMILLLASALTYCESGKIEFGEYDTSRFHSS